MQTVAIVGVGLIGGSFGLALREAGFRGKILGVSSPGTISEALKIGAIDSPATLAEAVATADLIYLAQPILSILRTIDAISDLQPRQGCLITDAGSTKQQIVAQATVKLGATQFARRSSDGREGIARRKCCRTGSFSKSNVCPDTRFSLGFRNRNRCGISRLARSDGSRRRQMTPEIHDRTVAFTSHLPQLLSTALACTLSNTVITDEQRLVSGPGLSDAVRLSLSDYQIWRDILSTNRQNIELALQCYIDKLSDFRQNLTDPSMEDQFRIAADTARKFRR